MARDKIKGKSGGRLKKDVRRPVSAGLKKRLYDKRREEKEAESTEREAVAQTEQAISTAFEAAKAEAARIPGAVFNRYGERRKSTKSRRVDIKERAAAPGTAPKVRREAGIKERARFFSAPGRTDAETATPSARPTGDVYSAHVPADGAKAVHTAAVPSRRGASAHTATPAEPHGLDTAERGKEPGKPVTGHVYFAPVPPTPQERMRELAVKKKREKYRNRRQLAAHKPGRGDTAQICPPAQNKPERAFIPEHPTPDMPEGAFASGLYAPNKTERAFALERPATSAEYTSAHPTAHSESAALTSGHPEKPGTARTAAGNAPKAAQPRISEKPPIYPSIRERPKNAPPPKERAVTGASAPKMRKDAERIAEKAATPIKTPAALKKHDAKIILERGRRKAQRDAARKMARRTQSAKTARAAAELSKKAVAAVARAVTALISSLAALVGGGALAVFLCVILLLAGLAASPFGVLFTGEPSRGAVSLNAAVAQISAELTDILLDLQTGDYDRIVMNGSTPDWREVVAVFAVKTAGADDGVDVAELVPDRVERLRAVFWDMCSVSSEEETILYPDTDPEDNVDDSYTETVLTITVTAKTAEEMRAEYGFSDFQNSVLTELLAEMSSLDLLLEDLSISQYEALELYRGLPDGLDPARRAVIKAACSLVGKVGYFWGGKSLVIGWDSRWGTLRKVTSEGSDTTGAYRPYGLDCSGFVDWAFYNATDGGYYPGHGGGTVWQHSYCTDVAWEDAQPGDLVFYAGDEHVGIVGGWDAEGNMLVIHCGGAGVSITGADDFAVVARPEYFD